MEVVAHFSERTFDVKANVLDSTKLYEYPRWEPWIEFGKGLLRNWECCHA